MTDQIIFEHPLNERIRSFLRLEHLFRQVMHFLPHTDTWSSRAAIYGLLDIINILHRADLKTEILKELDRHASNLGKIRQQPGIDMQMLGQILDRLEQSTSQVYALNGQIGQRLKDNEFLKSILQRSSIPGGACSFDLPQFHRWVSQPHAIRQQQLIDWLQDLDAVRKAIILLLSLVRSSMDPKPETATNGFFQRSLDAQLPAQLIRVSLDQSYPVFPEISGNKHRFSIRFMEATEAERPLQIQHDVEFGLTCCVI